MPLGGKRTLRMVPPPARCTAISRGLMVGCSPSKTGAGAGPSARYDLRRGVQQTSTATVSGVAVLLVGFWYIEICALTLAEVSSEPLRSTPSMNKTFGFASSVQSVG